MAMYVCSGAGLQCSFGTAPSGLQVVTVTQSLGNMPQANIMDYVPMLNIMPFGMCSSLANPTVASATAAAQGVLTTVNLC